MRIKPFLVSLTIGMMATSAAMAQLPDTEIFLTEVKHSGNTYTLGSPQNITNRVGYDNQPFFTPDGKALLYSSIRENKNADVYSYDLKSGQTSQFTNTPEDEYSPIVSPDGKYITVVRVEKDSTQRIWKFPIKGGEPSLLLKKVDSVGYYCWLQPDVVAANIITEPNSLRFCFTGRDGHELLVHYNAGRALQHIRHHHADRIYFVDKQKDQDSATWICEAGLLYTPKRVIRTLEGSEDFAVDGKGVIYMGSKGRLYKFHPDKDKDWVQIADFSNTPVKDFYRLAVNNKGDRIALVSFIGKKP